MRSKKEQALHYRRKYRGLISIDSKPKEIDSRLLSVIYTPGVAQPCEHIAEHPEDSFTHSGRGNTVAILSDGSSALGMGDVGPEATLPILESKAIFLKKMAGLNVLPLALETRDVDEIVETAGRIAPTVSAISLEDISSPRCFEIEQRLNKRLDIPVLHNDQHGTAITALAILHNVSRLHNEYEIEDMSAVITGGGAAGVASVRLLAEAGIQNITLCDREGVIRQDRQSDLSTGKRSVLPLLNDPGEPQDLEQAVQGKDVFLGLSAPGILTGDMVRTMAEDPVIIAGAAPNPEIQPDEANEAGAYVVSTARFDYPNMVTDVLALPGLFRGAIETGSGDFSTEMMLETARAIAEVVPDNELRRQFILPELLDHGVGPAVSEAASRVAIDQGLAREDCPSAQEIRDRTREHIYEGDPVEPDDSFWSELDEPTEQDLGLRYYRNHRGPLTLKSKIALKDRDIMGILYIPCLSEVVKTVRNTTERSFELSCRGNHVAVATNGSAVLGLGDIGVPAAMPVMEGKSVIFKTFGGVEAFPLCIEDDDDPEQFIDVMKEFEPSLGGINLEDIASPDCFQIERTLRDELDIPVFHDDQHGTAIVILAGLKNALQLTDRTLSDAKIMINGAGAAALATARILREAGAEHLIICDSSGPIYPDRGTMNDEKRKVAEWTNQNRVDKFDAAVDGSDVFIGLSVADVLSQNHVRSMADDPIIFALANPRPEIMPPDAHEAGAGVVATGRSDFANQVNNAIAFPGIFRGALDVRATSITESMKLAASEALSDIVCETGLRSKYILPEAMDFRTAPRVAEYVARAAIKAGVARRRISPDKIRENTRDYIYEGRLSHLENSS